MRAGTVAGAPSGSAAVGTLMAIGGGASNQLGAALGASAFGVLGPVGVVAVRQVVAATVLLTCVRPGVRRLGALQWRSLAALALVLATMNISLYTAVDRLGLALAVTLEFLGPLAVALLGSRTLRDLAVAAAAGAGVWLLVQPDGSSDYPGIALALLAALCWACYILLNRQLGQTLQGMDAPALASGLASLLYVPVLVVVLVHTRPGWQPLALAAAAGVLSSALPYGVDALALRRITAAAFGLLMSLNPVLAAAAGLLLLDQRLGAWQWAGIGVVVAANAAALAPRRRRRGEGSAEMPHPDGVAALSCHPSGRAGTAGGPPGG